MNDFGLNDLCILDVLRILTMDKTSRIHLNDPDFSYTSISGKSEQIDGAKLIYPEDISASTNSIKYHESRLNASLVVNYSAEVPLNPCEFKNTGIKESDLSKYGWKIEDRYPVNCFRTYNIIFDGKLNTKKLVLSDLQDSSKNALSSLLTLREDGKYILDLSSIPLINSNCMGTGFASELALDCWMQYVRATEISVFKYLLKQQEDFKTASQDPDKLAFLSEKYYIKNDSYQPPKTQISADRALVHEFTVSFKGYSKVSTASVIKKIDSGKSVTPRERLVEYFYLSAKNLPRQVIEDNLKCASIQQKVLASKIQGFKFATILLNNGCLQGCDSQENMSVIIDPNRAVSMGLDPITVEFNIIQKEIEI